MPHNFKNKMLLFLSGHRDDFSIATCYQNGLVVEKDIDTALFFYKQAASSGNVEAYLQIGVIQEQLGKIEQATGNYYTAARQNNEQAKQHLLRLASSGHASTKYYLGALFEQNKEWQKARDIYDQSAKKGHASSFYRLALLYQQDRITIIRGSQQVIIRKDLATELDFYRQGALLGCKHSLNTLLTLSTTQAQAAFILAEFYMKGTAGLAQNIKQAETYYLKASDLGDVRASLFLGNLYEQGNGEIKKNIMAAYQHYLSAAKKSNVDARAAVERLLVALNDPSRELEFSKICQQIFQDMPAAVRWYRKAIEKNINDVGIDCADVTLLYAVAKSYEEDGETPLARANAIKHYQVAIKKNSHEALQALEKLAEQGDAEAQYALAEYLHQKNKSLEAARLCMQAVEKQHEKALHYLMETKFSVEIYLELAHCYDYGKKVLKNIHHAIKFYICAANLGNANAALRLGQLHLIDHPGREKDLNLAWHYFMQAATLGNREALLPLNRLGEEAEAAKQLALARCYQTKIKDDTKAQYWYQQAAEAGNQEAKQSASILTPSLAATKAIPLVAPSIEKQHTDEPCTLDAWLERLQNTL